MKRNRISLVLSAILCIVGLVSVAYGTSIQRHYTQVIQEQIGVASGSRRTIRGTISIFKIDPDGSQTLLSVTENNLTVNADGITYHAQRLFNASTNQNASQYIAIGTGTDADGDPTNNTALETELDRQAATFYIPDDSYDAGLNYTFSFGLSYTITEAGVLPESSGGYLIFYVNNLSQAVTASDTYLVNWKFDYDQA